MENMKIYLQLSVDFYIFAIIYFTLFLLYIKQKEKNYSTVETLVCAFSFISIIFVFGMTIGCVDFSSIQLQDIARKVKTSNLTPFVTIKDMCVSVFHGNTREAVNLFGNIGVFVPIGFFNGIFFWNSRHKYRKMFFTGMLLSLTIELIQIGAVRSFDVDDIILNALGTLLGFCLLTLLRIKNLRLPQNIKLDIDVPKNRNTLKIMFCTIIICQLTFILLNILS